MSDPVFQTRDQLAARARELWFEAWQSVEWLENVNATIDRIKRVTLAHVHLPLTTKDEDDAE
jgi:hypothetical protein